ncbi:chromosome-associated kinesin KIF4-like [Anastrepha obliqua]|uniref:chromosome-associated kinesin KIF4-like n=1 Tax=Anastrepha obliqua TaxID=95512 RepID=UPI00240A45EC|nr:chromosome-associated kinesin KIF4-like [Anastrepha obliqua]
MLHYTKLHASVPLSDKLRGQSIVEMRENRNGIVMPGLTETQVSSVRETTDCLLRGSSGRAVAATAMNEQSSRSHAIFTITVEATKKDEMSTVTTSKFHLVDLAGSERSKKTQATGDSFKEGVKINQRLLALGNVISALGYISSSNNNSLAQSLCEACGSEINAEIGDKNTIPDPLTTHLEKIFSF